MARRRKSTPVEISPSLARLQTEIDGYNALLDSITTITPALHAKAADILVVTCVAAMRCDTADGYAAVLEMFKRNRGFIDENTMLRGIGRYDNELVKKVTALCNIMLALADFAMKKKKIVIDPKAVRVVFGSEVLSTFVVLNSK